MSDPQLKIYSQDWETWTECFRDISLHNDDQQLASTAKEAYEQMRELHPNLPSMRDKTQAEVKKSIGCEDSTTEESDTAKSQDSDELLEELRARRMSPSKGKVQRIKGSSRLTRKIMMRLSM